MAEKNKSYVIIEMLDEDEDEQHYGDVAIILSPSPSEALEFFARTRRKTTGDFIVIEAPPKAPIYTITSKTEYTARARG